MEIKILDNIIHGILKPWQINTANKKRFTELVKAEKAASPGTGAELHTQLSALLADFPVLQTVLSAEPPETKSLQPLLFKSELPKYNDGITQFYYYVITAETLRVFNSVLQQAANWTELVDIRYQVGKTLTNVRVLAKQTSIELIEQGFTTVPYEQSNLIHLSLYWLKHSLIALYFSIQETFKGSLKQVTTLEDFYLLDLELPSSEILALASISNNEYSANQESISFGFKDDAEKLKNVVNQLCHQIEFLNQDVTSADAFIKTLTVNSILPGAVKIQIGCETKHFRYCIDKFTPYFNHLTLANIEKSKLFFSKKDTLIKANNLSSSSSKNKLEPKEKATIDKIFKHLQ